MYKHYTGEVETNHIQPTVSSAVGTWKVMAVACHRVIVFFSLDID